MKQSGNQLLNGPQRECFAGGELSAEGRFREMGGRGKWKYYYRNGRPKAVGKYVNGKFDGNWQWWRKAGRLSRSIEKQRQLWQHLR